MKISGREHVICSLCFKNEGLRICSDKYGWKDGIPCPQCGQAQGAKLTQQECYDTMSEFFVFNTQPSFIPGFAPVLQINEHHKGEDIAEEYREDHDLLMSITGHGAFLYAPQTFHVGDTTYIEKLYDPLTRDKTIDEIIEKCQSVTLSSSQKFYRLRMNIQGNPFSITEYDSPPAKIKRNPGRFDSEKTPILYGSFDVNTCVHECRTTFEDDLYIATLTPARDLKILNLYDAFDSSGESDPWQSIAISIDAIMCSKDYKTCRAIAGRIKYQGYDGFFYKSHFYQLHEGATQDIALFGFPVNENKVRVESINSLRIENIILHYKFGPVVA